MTTSENSASQTPPHYLDAHALLRPNKPALICEERSLTYAQYNTRARRVANALRKLGVQAGDRIAVMAHNSIELLEVAAGLSKLSAISVLLNYRLREQEIAYILNDSQAKIAIAGPGLIGVVDKARALTGNGITCIAIGDEAEQGWLRYEDLLAEASTEAPGSANGLGPPR